MPHKNNSKSSVSALQHVAPRGNPPDMLFDNDKRLMTVAELADRLNVSRAFVYVLITEHGLPRVKLGRAVRFRWEEIEGWLAERSFM
jgi:excisionase family DNA binding protein